MVDDEIEVARGDHLAVEQAALAAGDAGDAAAGRFDGHHLLHHLLLVRVEEPCQLARVQRGVQLEEAAQRRHRRLRAHVREEEREMPLCGLAVRFLDVRGEQLGVLIRRRVRGDELWARVQEEFFERGDAFLAVRGTRATRE